MQWGLGAEELQKGNEQTLGAYFCFCFPFPTGVQEVRLARQKRKPLRLTGFLSKTAQALSAKQLRHGKAIQEPFLSF